MTEQYKVITTGELNASIEGFGEFTTKEVEFIGSDDDPDFLLQGTNSERGFIFYLPKYESEKYSLHPGSAAKVFYEVGGRLYGEVEEGFIKVTVTKPETVVIEFDVSVKESAGETTIRLIGSGTFKGRVPWANRHRELLNVVQGGAPLLFEGPDIVKPKPGEVSPGFEIVGRTDTVGVPSDWELQIIIGSTVVLQNTGQSGREFSYDVPANLIPLNTKFYFRLDYYIWPIWSKWTYSGDLVMGLGSPEILHPFDNDVVATDKPQVSGRGYPGATVQLVQAGSGAVVYGTSTVNQRGEWGTTLTVSVPYFPFQLQAMQTLNSMNSGWSNVVTIHQLRKPFIRLPAAGSTVRKDYAVPSGDGSPGARIELYQHGNNTRLYGSAKVDEHGKWTTHASRLPLGMFYMTALQIIDDENSEYSDLVGFTVID